MLVTGPNGSGKSSLFRVLGGLWPMASGHLSKPGTVSLTANGLPDTIPRNRGLNDDIFYVPQRPYTALGTLRDQLIYPLSRADAAAKLRQWELMEGRYGVEGATIVGTSFENIDDQAAALEALDVHLQTILESVRLLYLLKRQGGWEGTAKWEDMLSLGEQQRLGMARLFFQRPKFGILDECTNATSVDVEEGLYRQAQSQGITVVTISQRPALVPFHSTELRLIDGEGAWELRDIKQQKGTDHH
eukprot:TRINITY_DN5387_c0_g1_i1.p1 TRINITY_DN5387_c0_g1~~TRINITY_DN5387_c0_g1_i1.p1  ORF type:complete len:279 (+),score=51.01 TRINITY_DN5387_c0_g1_i1:103-837(+)